MADKLRFVDIETFKATIKDVEQGDAYIPPDGTALCLRKQFVPEIKAIDDEKRTVSFVISTEAVDRDRDTIRVAGWQLKNFKKNPVVLFAHDSRTPPIAQAKNVRKEDGALKADAQFLPPDMAEHDHVRFTDMIFQMIKGKFLRATSVGFLPISFQRVDDDDDRKFGLDFLKTELLEFSIVPVPSNPEALVQARSAGIDTQPAKLWAERILDEWEKDGETGIYLPRSDVEAVYRAADELRTTAAMLGDQSLDLALRNIEAIKRQSDGAGETGVECESLDEPGHYRIHEGPVLSVEALYVDYERVGQDKFTLDAEEGTVVIRDYEFDDETIVTVVFTEMPDDPDGPEDLDLDTEEGVERELSEASVEKQRAEVLDLVINGERVAEIPVDSAQAAQDFLAGLKAEAEAQLTQDMLDWADDRSTEKTVIGWGAAHPDGTPKAPKDEAWSGGAQVSAAEIGDLLVMATWREAKARDDLKKGDFKLPHHKADGHAVVWRGVTAAMGALLGARGGVAIPDGERKGVYNHLARHYRDDFDETPPDFKNVELEVLARTPGTHLQFDYDTGRLITCIQSGGKDFEIAAIHVPIDWTHDAVSTWLREHHVQFKKIQAGGAHPDQEHHIVLVREGKDFADLRTYAYDRSLPDEDTDILLIVGPLKDGLGELPEAKEAEVEIRDLITEALAPVLEAVVRLDEAFAKIKVDVVRPKPKPEPKQETKADDKDDFDIESEDVIQLVRDTLREQLGQVTGKVTQ